MSVFLPQVSVGIREANLRARPGERNFEIQLARRFRSWVFTVAAFLTLGVILDFGKAAEAGSFVPESENEWEHHLWLGVQEEMLLAEEASALRERLLSFGGERGDGIMTDSERLREVLSVEPENGMPLSVERMLDRAAKLEAYEAKRKERVVAASGNLALAWLDEMVLFPEADRSAWSRHLSQWVEVEGFTAALERGRRFFLSHLPTLKLPPMDSSLVLSETQAALLQYILTGEYHGEMGDFFRYAKMNHEQLEQEERRIMQELEGEIIDPETAEAQLTLIFEAMKNWNFGMQENRHSFTKKQEKVVRFSAWLLLEQQAADLGVLPGEAEEKHYAGAKGAITLWGEHFRERIWGVWFFRRLGRIGYGIWDVDLEFLTGQPVYQRALREILPLERYDDWLRKRRKRRFAGIKSMGDYALAQLDSQLSLSSRQRERARAYAMIFDAEKQEIRERALMNAVRFRFGLPNELLPNPYRREAELYRSYFDYMLQGLSKGYLTPWQQRVTASLQEEAAN